MILNAPTILRAATILLVLSTSTAAQFTFVNSGQSLSAFNARDVALGDVDADGDLDAAVTTGSPTEPNQIWLNDGNGNFSLGSTIGGFDFAGDGLKLADMNGDNSLDCIISGPSGWRILFNDGIGTFTDSGQLVNALGGCCRDVAVGDLDGDGDNDLVDYANLGLGQIYINNGTGTMTAAGMFADGGDALALDTGDMDGDGDTDIVTFSSQGSKIHFNDGSGNFTTSVCPHSATCASVHNGQAYGDIGDIDGDGDIDIMELFRFAGINRVWINDGSGSFTAGAGNGTPSSRRGTVDDIDGDGNADTIRVTANFLRIRRSNGDGTLTVMADLQPGVNAVAVQIGDLDGDGDGDLFVAGNGADQVIFNTSQPATYPGSGEGLNFDMRANNVPVTALGNPTNITTGQQLTMTFSNPSGSLQTAAPLIVAQSLGSGSATPTHVANFPTVWVTPTSAIFIQAPFAPAQLQNPLSFTFAIPALMGERFVIQAFGLTSSATNGFFASSRAFFVRII